MIRCYELLEEYSDFRDGLMTAERSGQIEAHLAACPSCATYHRVLVRGVDELRALSGLEPSEDFLPRLQYRIRHLEGTVAAGRSARGTDASALVVALLALLIAGAAWMPALRRPPPLVDLPPIAANAPAPVWEGPNAFTSHSLLAAPFPVLDVSPTDFFLRYGGLTSVAALQTAHHPVTSR